MENNKSTKIKKFLNVNPLKIKFISLHGRNRFDSLSFQYPSKANTKASLKYFHKCFNDLEHRSTEPIMVEINNKLFEINNWILTQIAFVPSKDSNIEICEIDVKFDQLLELGTIH